MNRLEDAKRAFEVEYDTAKQLNFERAICRTIGNLGMVNYQLSQQKNDMSLLDQAIRQLDERVARAQKLKGATHWESIGLARLSLCHSAHGNTQEAIRTSLASLTLLQGSRWATDPTVLALTRFFYGRALLRDGQKALALEQFNPVPDQNICTPAIALCKEPSEEHRGYLAELVAAGADMGGNDQHGYSALDYAVFNGDNASQDLVLEGLKNTLQGNVEAKLEAMRLESRLRKGYRELFQEKLRPFLFAKGWSVDGKENKLANRYGTNSVLQELRSVYANALATDAQKATLFDVFKYIPYGEFLRFGRLPRSSDGLGRVWKSRSITDDETKGGGEGEVVIFFSYRWINKDKSFASADDRNGTQYKRMISATEEFLRLHPQVERRRLGLWIVSFLLFHLNLLSYFSTTMFGQVTRCVPAVETYLCILTTRNKDHTCVDQSNPMPGVSALPMLLAQCDAIISLVDDAYHSRAWCSVEAMMAQVLMKSYGLYEWYEQVEIEGDPVNNGVQRGVNYVLREAPTNIEISMATKKLTFEDDRAKVLFLERQSKLLG